MQLFLQTACAYISCTVKANQIIHYVPGTTPFVAMALIDIAVSNVCMKKAKENRTDDHQWMVCKSNIKERKINENNFDQLVFVKFVKLSRCKHHAQITVL